jgi:ribonuclease Z
MRITLLGAGEAFDETLGNTSALVTDESTVLLDCGYAAPFQVWRLDASPDLIDAIYISHAHADHYFGLPALLTRMAEEGRKKPLTLISHQPVLAKISQLIELGYPGIRKRFEFAIENIAATAEADVAYREFRVRFAPTIHSVTNLAMRIEARGTTFCYSGDGMFTDASRALFDGADLLLHEAFSFDESAVHADIPRLIEMAGQVHVKHLVLTHVQRGVRRSSLFVRRCADLKSKVRVTLGTTGAVFDL